ncbi:MAG: S1C family serine protease [Candidatus Moraniibacteriota bacterium]
MKGIKKLLMIVLIGIGIVVLGGIGGVLIDAYTPNLASWPVLNHFSIFKKLTERVTVINKTEQVVIQEDDSVEKIASQPATAVVNIVVLPDENKTVKTTATTMTGVLLTNDGLIATYGEKPLVAAGFHYEVLLFDGTSHKADFFGYDTLTNLSFLRLNDGTNTPAIALANSDDARVGKKLIAIGNAFTEYQNRLAIGILGNINHAFNLSGKTVSSSEKLEGVLETDFNASENFIGGPAIGYSGEMIGLIGTLKIDNVARTFLIPANVVRESLDRAIGGTLVKRPVLGVYYLPITKTLALELGLARDHGALIYSPSGKTGLALLADSKAMKAGLQAGDLLVSINGQEITSDNPLSRMLGRRNTGDTIELLFIRDGEEKKVSIVL